MLRRWSDLAELEIAPDWSEEDRVRSEAVLSRLWDEQADARTAGEAVSYPKLFHAADPALAERYEAQLKRVNRRFIERHTEFATVLIDRLANAPVR